MSAVFKFEARQVPDEPMTREMGTPHYKDVDVVVIKPDERSTLVKSPEEFFTSLEQRIDRAANMDERDRCEQALERAKRSYARFKEGRPDEIEGRPLSEWPRMTPSLIQTLNHIHIFSVEDMAKASDTQVGKVHGGVRLRDEAIRYMEASDAEGASAVATRLAEMEARMETLIEENAELKKLIPSDKPKRGRPRKEAA